MQCCWGCFSGLCINHLCGAPLCDRPQLMEAIVKEGPEAERVAMTMTYTYKAAGQVEGITQVRRCAWRLTAWPAVMWGRPVVYTLFSVRRRRLRQDGRGGINTRTLCPHPLVQPAGQAYAAAAERLPRDPEVLSGLFRAHVRCVWGGVQAELRPAEDEECSNEAQHWGQACCTVLRCGRDLPPWCRPACCCFHLATARFSPTTYAIPPFRLLLPTHQ